MFLKFKLLRASKAKKVDLAYLNQRTPLWKVSLFILPALAVLGFFTLYPFFVTADNALHPLANPHKAASATFGLSEFKKVVDNYYFKQALSNSLIYAIIAIPAAIIISLLISATISSIVRKRARGVWQTIFFLPYVTSGVAVSMAFAYLFNENTGLINKLFHIDTNWLNNSSEGNHNALWVMIIRGIWGSLAFQILIFTTAMLGVDKDRYKAASIDGAGPVKQFFAITLPSIRRTLNFIITISLIGAIKIFPLALFDMNPTKAKQMGGSTLMLYVFEAVSTGHYQAAGASAIILVAIAISFNVVVKNAFNGMSKLFIKGGEWHVQRKIKAKGQVR